MANKKAVPPSPIRSGVIFERVISDGVYWVPILIIG